MLKEFKIQHSNFKIVPVAGEQGLEFADDLLGGGLRDQVALDFQLERLLEEIGSVDPHL